MKKLIDKESPLYLRRMVREINRLLRSGKSVYKLAYPFNTKVTAVFYGPYTKRILAVDTDGRYTDSGPDDFFYDHTSICASRAPSR